ncbi:MAG TPA: hypothetical protein VEK34_07250 [Methylocella sp.]|nr:hypothetical protein [Methylocella sp.]
MRSKIRPIAASAALVLASSCGPPAGVGNYDRRSYDAGFADGRLATCNRFDPGLLAQLEEADICPPENEAPSAVKEEALK